MCIVVDICDTLLLLLLLDMFFTFPPAGPQTKGLVKSLDFPTQLVSPACGPSPGPRRSATAAQYTGNGVACIVGDVARKKLLQAFVKLVIMAELS